jgi:hypothetical protein
MVNLSSFVATDKKNKSSNDYSVVIGETDKTFTAYFKAENFKMISVTIMMLQSQNKR